MSITYLTYLCIFGFCWERYLAIQWTRLHARHVLWYGFLGSGEFFTRTKETHLTVVLFQAFQKRVVSVGFLDLHLFIVHECSLYFCYEFCCLYIYPVYFHHFLCSSMHVWPVHIWIFDFQLIIYSFYIFLILFPVCFMFDGRFDGRALIEMKFRSQ